MPILKKAVRLVRRFLRLSAATPASALAQKAASLEQSGNFEAAWYLKEYPDVAAHSYWSQHPCLHYLKIGGFEGRKPISWFDSAWYLKKYPDVMNSGLNPLLHFVEYGVKEKRKPNNKRYKKHATDYIRERIVKHLWGGHSEAALARLKAIYLSTTSSNENRFFAAWHAARWYYFVQDFDQALALAELICSLDERYRLHKITVMIYTYCYLDTGRVAEAEHVLRQYLSLNPADEDMQLALANTLSDNNERLAQINAVFIQHNLAPLHQVDDSKPLSLANISASAEPVRSSLKVSVIIPTYNSADKLAIAIESLLQQSWQNLEIIVVDDCSPDDTFAVATAYAEKDGRVKALQQPVNGGAYLARNSGLAVATGDFITTHDGDDWSHPQKIATQMAYLAEHPRVMGVCTYWIRARDTLHFTQNWRLNPELIHWSHSSFLFRREVVAELGYWDAVVVGGDTEYIWRVQAKYGNWAVKTIKPTVPFAFALDDEGSLTRSKATHVKTIHHGLRHIYRSCAQWWHKHSAELKVIADRKTRAFAAPNGMLRRTNIDVNCDVIFIADFSSKKRSLPLLALIEKAISDKQSIALYHWPQFGKIVKPLIDDYFVLLQADKVQPVVYGQHVIASRMVIENEKLLQHIPEQLPRFAVSTVEVISARTNVLCAVDEATRSLITCE